MRDDKKLEENEQRRRLRIIDEGVKSEYWAVLKDEIQGELDKLQGKLDRMNQRRLSASDLTDRDYLIFQRDYLKSVLQINQTLIKQYSNWLERTVGFLQDYLSKSTSFVGKITK